MQFKKNIFFLAAVLIFFSACKKDPDYSDTFTFGIRHDKDLSDYEALVKTKSEDLIQKTKAFREKHQIPQYIALVDGDNELVGVMSREDALARAKEMEVDLVEIAPKAVPPVAKLIEYGKMLYMLKKKEHAAKKAGKSLEQKGIRITFRMGDGDLDRQRNHTAEFLEKGHSVKVQLVMRGRENAHKDIAHQKMRAFCESLKESGKLEQNPRGSGFQIIAILKPLKAA